MLISPLFPQVTQASLPGGEGRIGSYLVVEIEAEAADGEGVVDDVVGQAGENVFTFRDGDELADEVSAFGALDVVDAFLTLSEERKQLRTGLLDARELYLLILQVGEVIAPVGCQDNLVFLDEQQVDDAVGATGNLDDELQAFLPHISGEVGHALVECGSSLIG